ncbi:STE24 endopeptidase [Thiogranum longum]|uniref:STE24 endopeptidase n=1 Tax=Thiogranum longum TaxID=1537524 RepID=A0A4R1HCD2_9GAMM|nr:M48 family metallopeptidase [Thiogranum longum]TCK17905.1 STE24 endopeptidase [Thiogranum longum]
MNTFSWIFVIALALSLGVKLWLAQRQIRAVSLNRNRVPDAFADKIPLDAHKKAADYTLANTRLGRLELLWSNLLLLGWTLGGGLQWLSDLWQGFGWQPVPTGVALMISAFMIMAVLDLPFSLYHTFVLEERFGFNKTTLGTWLGDMLKQTLLMLALGVPLAWAALWLMQESGSLWWLWLWLLWTGFSLLMLWAYPAVIAPLFNKFTLLDDDKLQQRIQSLLDRCGFKSKGIYVMDGSRRSGHGNAYFTGMGQNKRIVFFDTLLETLDADEIEAVLAHELGHFKRKHVQKRIFTMMLMSLAGLALLGWLSQQPWFYQGLGVQTQSNALALLLFMMVSPVFTIFLQPLSSWFSRKHEFEADDYAAQQASASDLIHALVKMYKENASTLTPDPLYSAFYDSHPPAPVRVAHLSGKTR